jgi:hypothetical protein
MKINAFLIPFLSLSLAVLPAWAAGQPQSLGKFGFWETYQVSENNQPVCYMSITGPAPQAPAVKKGKPATPKRGNIVLMVTHRPAEGSKDVVSYAAGVKFKNASDAKIKIGDKEFSLFTQNDTAWSRDAATDHALAAALQSADALTMYGESVKGDALADKVALKGARQAYLAISKACGLPVVEAPKNTHPKAAPVAPKTKGK